MPDLVEIGYEHYFCNDRFWPISADGLMTFKISSETTVSGSSI
jgi:hypothetical protein